MAFRVGEVVATLRLDTKGWDKSIEKVKKDMKELRKYLDKNGFKDVNLSLTLDIKTGE